MDKVNCEGVGDNDGFFEIGVSAPPAMARAHAKQIEAAKILGPLILHVATGGWLEFRHNDNEWRICKGENLRELAMSPHRYRIAN